MKFSDVALWIKETEEIHKSKQLRDMIQRKITDRVGPIVEYLIEQPERFFNAIVVGVYGGNPKWYPINVGDSPAVGAPDLEDEDREAIGLLMLEGDEKLFAIDGQHRVVAIKHVLKRKSALKTEQICAIFVAHGNDEKGMMRTRRLFSTLNRYAVPVSKGEIVALSEDDAYAIVTRKLVEEFNLFKSAANGSGFVDFRKMPNLPKTDRTSLTTILTLYDITYAIYVPSLNLNKEQKRHFQRLKHRRPDERTLADIYKEQVAYWKLLKNNFAQLEALFNSDPEDHVAGKYRTPSGGHLMFRPIGQKAFAGAVRIMMDRGIKMGDAVRVLSGVPMQLNRPPWLNVLWRPTAQRINSKVNVQLLENLLLYLVGQQPHTDRYNLTAEYRRALDNPRARLPKAIFKATK